MDLHAERRKQVLGFLAEKGEVKSGEVMSFLGYSSNVVYSLLNLMAKDGLITKRRINDGIASHFVYGPTSTGPVYNKRVPANGDEERSNINEAAGATLITTLAQLQEILDKPFILSYYEGDYLVTITSKDLVGKTKQEG